MKKDYALKEAKSILSQFNEIVNNENVLPGFPYKTENVIREFVHLVYAYDSNLPLNDSIKNITFNLSEKDVEKIRYYMEFFIHYLDDYS